MKISQLFVIGSILLAIAATPVDANISTGKALTICKDTIRARTDGSVYHKFRNRPATSTRGEKYTFWIDSTLKNEQQKYLLRSKCVTDNNGDILLVEIEEGRW